MNVVEDWRELREDLDDGVLPVGAELGAVLAFFWRYAAGRRLMAFSTAEN